MPPLKTLILVKINTVNFFFFIGSIVKCYNSVISTKFKQLALKAEIIFKEG